MNFLPFCWNADDIVEDKEHKHIDPLPYKLKLQHFAVKKLLVTGPDVEI